METAHSHNIPFPLLLLPLLLLIGACSGVADSNTDEDKNDEKSEWLIPADQVYQGAARDGIPSIDDPHFSSVSDIDFMQDGDLVLAIKIGDEVKAYPHKVLNYHEIVNDRVAGTPVAVTFCPLTGSGLAWNREVNGEATTFGVSGFIFKNNLIAYDRLTETYWSQMKNLGVKGPKKGTSRKTYALVETTWETWKSAYPDSRVLTGNTGYDWNYASNPYGANYPDDNNNILFPIEREDDRLERKTLAHGIFYNTSPLVIPIEGFPDRMTVINHNHNGNDIVIAGHAKRELAVTYSRKTKDGTLLKFSNTSEELPALMEDSEGNVWNLFGEAISGPRTGQRLQRIPSYNAYWFAWADFFGRLPKIPKIYYP